MQELKFRVLQQRIRDFTTFSSRKSLLLLIFLLISFLLHCVYSEDAKPARLTIYNAPRDVLAIMDICKVSRHLHFSSSIRGVLHRSICAARYLMSTCL